MKKIFVLCTALLVMAMALQGQEVIECGSKIFFLGTDDTHVFLKGKDLGSLPRFIDYAGKGQEVFEFQKNASRVSQTFSFSDSQKGLTYFTPSFEVIEGILKIQHLPDTAYHILIDRKEYSYSTEKEFRLLPGTYELSILADSYASIRQKITLEAGQTLDFDFVQEPGYGLHFALPLIEDIEVSVLDVPGLPEKTFYLSEAFLLPAGQCTLELKSAAFASPRRVSLDPKASTAFITLDDPKGGTIVFDSKLAKDAVLINTEAVPETAKNAKTNTVDLVSGVSVVHVLEGDIYQFSDLVYLAPGETLKGNDLLQNSLILVPGDKSSAKNKGAKNPGSKKELFSTTFTILFLSGGALLTAGLLLNPDEVLLPVSDTYETYAALKYTTLAGAALGAGLMITSLFF